MIDYVLSEKHVMLFIGEDQIILFLNGATLRYFQDIWNSQIEIDLVSCTCLRHESKINLTTKLCQITYYLYLKIQNLPKSNDGKIANNYYHKFKMAAELQFCHFVCFSTMIVVGHFLRVMYCLTWCGVRECSGCIQRRSDTASRRVIMRWRSISKER